MDSSWRFAFVLFALFLSVSPVAPLILRILFTDQRGLSRKFHCFKRCLLRCSLVNSTYTLNMYTAFMIKYVPCRSIHFNYCWCSPFKAGAVFAAYIRSIWPKNGFLNQTFKERTSHIRPTNWRRFCLVKLRQKTQRLYLSQYFCLFCLFLSICLVGLFFRLLTIVRLWPEYCRYGIKKQINQSIICFFFRPSLFRGHRCPA